MAARYWVGGSGFWQAGNTANWSATSGGAGGASVPTSADTANFNANSGGGTVYVIGDMPCLYFNTTGFTGAINCNTYNGYISHYNGSCTIGATNASGVDLNIYNRATGTTAYTLNFLCPNNPTLRNYSKLGSNSGTYTIAYAATTGYTYLVVGNITHPSSSGTLNITNNATAYYGYLFLNGTLDLYGNCTLSGGTTSGNQSYMYGTVNFLAGGTTANITANWYSSATINIAKTVTFNTSSGSYAQNYYGTINVTGGATVSDGRGVYFAGVVNVSGGSFRLYYSSGGVSSSAAFSLTGGTLQLGGNSGAHSTIASLTITGSGSKSLLMNSSTFAYLDVAGSISIGGSGTITFPAYNWYIAHTGSSFSVSDNQGNSGYTTLYAYLNLTINTSVPYHFLGSGETLSIKQLTLSGTAMIIRLQAILSVGTLFGCNATEQFRYLITSWEQATISMNVTTWTSQLNYCDFYGIVMTGTAAAPSRGGDCGRNSGITFSAPVSRYWVGGATSQFYYDSSYWSASSGGAGGQLPPLAHDTAYFDLNSGSSSGSCAISERVPATIVAFSYLGIINSTALIYDYSYFYMSFTVNRMQGGVYLANTAGTTKTFSAKIVPSGQSLAIHNRANGNTIAPSDAWWAIGSDNTVVTTLNFNGSSPIRFNTQDFTIGTQNTNGVFSMGTAVSGNLGTSTIITRNCYIQSSALLTSNAKIVSAAYADSTLRLLSGMNIASYTVSGTGAGSSLTTLDVNNATIGEIKSDPIFLAYTISFQAGSSFTVGKWSISGAAGKLVSLRSSSPGTQYTMTYSGATFVSADYLDIQDSAVVPDTVTWYAGTHSTNSGNNNGWIFTAPPSGNGLLFGSNF